MQSVLAGYGRYFGLDEDTAIKLGRTLGAGAGNTRICGAVAGAFMLLGFTVDKADHDNDEYKARTKAKELAGDFQRRFSDRHGDIFCLALLDGADINTKEGLTRAKAEGMFKTWCPGFVKSAAEILDEMVK